MTNPRRPPHKTAHVDCPNGAANWADCDKVSDGLSHDWEAFQQVLLAYRLALTGKRIKEKGLFPQLIDLILGHRHDLMTDEGNPNESPWAHRLRAAIERFKAGDFPRYNLYRIPGLDPDTMEGNMAHDTDVAPETESASSIPQREQAGAFTTAPKFSPLPEEPVADEPEAEDE